MPDVRLIDANALEIKLKAFLDSRKAYEDTEYGRLTSPYADAINALREEVMDMPTIEAEPVKHGQQQYQAGFEDGYKAGYEAAMNEAIDCGTLFDWYISSVENEEPENAKSEALKPCPFCGGEAEVGLGQERDDYGNCIGSAFYVVSCKACGAEVSNREKQISLEPKEMAIVAQEGWNTRSHKRGK